MTTNTETMEQKNERNARVSARYDELMREGKHGHYETLFRVVREECDRVRAADREARPAPASVEVLRQLVDLIDQTLTVPAAEYVPAIRDAWSHIATLRDQLAALATQAAPEAQAEPAGAVLRWALEFGAWEFPVGHPSRVTEIMLFDSEIEAHGQGEVCGFNSRVFPIYARPAASGERDTLRALLREARDRLDKLVTYAQSNECTHEDTYRGGAIWTICRGCDRKWSDDRNPFKPYKEPAAITNAANSVGRIDAALADGGATHE